MASNSETGNAKNVANFEDLISFCTGYGATYNPSKAAIKIPALQIIFTNGKNVIQDVTATKTAYTNAVNSRQIAFNPLRPLATRIVNALEATDATDEMIADAKSINNKIQGKRSTPKKVEVPDNPDTPENEEVKNFSSSQQSYDQLIEHFNALIELVKSEPTYTPNEVELQVVTLTANLATMKTTNTAVSDGYTAWSNARIARNDVLYKKDTGLVDIAFEVKKYVKSVFGASSAQFKQVSKLKFTSPR